MNGIDINPQEILFPFSDPITESSDEDISRNYFRLKEVVFPFRKRMVDLKYDAVYEYVYINPALRVVPPEGRTKIGGHFFRKRAIPVRQTDLLVKRETNDRLGIVHAIAPRDMYADQHIWVFPVDHSKVDVNYLDLMLNISLMWIEPKELNETIQRRTVTELWIPKLSYLKSKPYTRDLLIELFNKRRRFVDDWYRTQKLEMDLYDLLNPELDHLLGTQYVYNEYGKRHVASVALQSTNDKVSKSQLREFNYKLRIAANKQTEFNSDEEE